MGIPKSAERAPLPLAGMTILVVEDHADSRDMTRQSLQAQGAGVWLAVNGRDALDVLRRIKPPDAILCDIRMPGMDGLKLAQRLRADLRWRRLPIVALTAYGEHRDYFSTLAAGFDAHLVKPVDLEAMVAVIRRLVTSARAAAKTRRRPRPPSSSPRRPPSA
ncbi:MAG: response regulator [Candidatus Rokuibacteriota bacterium]